MTTTDSFSTEEQYIQYLERVRWPNVPICPYCGAQNSTPMKDGKRHHCNGCSTTFSVTVRTVFHDSRLPLQKWFSAIKLILDTENNISIRRLAQLVKINRNTAWRIVNKVNDAMAKADDRQLLLEIVETQDEINEKNQWPSR